MCSGTRSVSTSIAQRMSSEKTLRRASSQGFLDLGLQDFAGQFVGDGHQQGGADQALCLGEDDEAALPRRYAVVLFSRRLTTRRQELPTVLAWLASSTVINQFLKLAGLHYVHPRGPEQAPARLIHRVMHSPWIRGY